MGYGPTYDGANYDRCQKVRRLLRAFDGPVLDSVFVPHAARSLRVPEHVVMACLRKIDKEDAEMVKPFVPGELF